MSAPVAATQAADEVRGPGGAPLAAYAGVLAALDATGAATAAGAIAAAVARDGIVHGAGDAEHLFHVDAVPRVFAAGEWADLEAGLLQRVRALEAFLADAYGPREAFAAGVVPADLLDRCPWAEDDVAKLPRPERFISIAGPDVVRAPDGELVVLEDNVRTPTLMAFALAARRLTTAALPGAPEAVPVEDALRSLLHGLVAPGASTVILGRDEGNFAWWEIEELGRLTGWPVVALEDLAVAGDRLVVRASGCPVDVLWRRTSEERLRDDAGELNALGALLLEPLRAGTLAVLNAFGTGAADDKRTYPYVEDLVRFFCGEEPLLRSIPSWDLGDPARRAGALDRLDELVLKPRTGSGGHGVVLGPRATAAQLRDVRAAIDADPSAWIAQELVALSTHPTVIDGRLEPRHVDLRPFVVGDRVLPGGLSRFAVAAGDLVVNCSQGGGGKDVRVLPPPTERPPARSLDQVDGRSGRSRP